jgi:hypothetical protein
LLADDDESGRATYHKNGVAFGFESRHFVDSDVLAENKGRLHG